jgi:hypothetical protein
VLVTGRGGFARAVTLAMAIRNGAADTLAARLPRELAPIPVDAISRA